MAVIITIVIPYYYYAYYSTAMIPTIEILLPSNYDHDYYYHD